MELVLPKGAYRRANGNLPPFELVNMFVEQTPSAKGGLSLLSFPGLASSLTRGSGPINGIYRRADLFSGAIFTVSDTHLYKDGTDLGAINGSGPVSWASTNTELVVTRGQSAYSYNGTNLAAIAFPDGANVTAVTAISERFIFARASSYRFYWSGLLDGRTVDAADYASAESAPDWLKDVLAVGDVLYLGGGESIEAWYPTGDGTLPYSRISQRTASKGVPFTGCLCELDNALHFVANDRCVYRMAEVPQKISHPGIDELLTSATTIKCFPMIFEGHSILNVRTNTKSIGFDVATQEWHERRTWGLANWVAFCCEQQSDGSPIFGSAVGDDLLIHSGWAEGTSSLSREWTAAIPLTSSVRIDSIEIEANTGAAALTAGTNPQVEMRYSRDRGNTWSAFRPASLGATGQYGRRPKWTRLGMFTAPGALFHFRVTDPVPIRVSGVSGEETSAGLSKAA
jgi:hypothetical protein